MMKLLHTDHRRETFKAVKTVHSYKAGMLFRHFQNDATEQKYIFLN